MAAAVGRALAGRVALVTGSTSGIGLGVASVLAQQGCNVMLNGFGDKAEIAATVQSVAAKHDVRVSHHGANLMEHSEIVDMVEATKEWSGNDRVDILVNNAGIQHVAPTVDFPVDMWNKIIAINLSAVFFTTQGVLPGMQAAGWGRVVNIASVHGLVGSADKAPYVASKHGVVGMTKVVALENAGNGVTCNAVCPGWVLTPLVQRQVDARAESKGLSIEDAKADLLAEKQPSMQFASPEDIGGAVSYLCSDYARQVTGTTLTVDGGWTAR